MKPSIEETAHAIMRLGAGIWTFSVLDQSTLVQTGFLAKFVAAANLLRINADRIVGSARDDRFDTSARMRNFAEIQQQLRDPQWKELFALSYEMELFSSGCMARIIKPGSKEFSGEVAILEGFVVRGIIERDKCEHLVRSSQKFACNELSLHNYEQQVALLRDALARRFAIAAKPHEESRLKFIFPWSAQGNSLLWVCTGRVAIRKGLTGSRAGGSSLNAVRAYQRQICIITDCSETINLLRFDYE